jgi:hypothetical protein
MLSEEENKMEHTTLGAAAERVAALSARCHDEAVPVADLCFDDLATVRIAGEPHPLRDTAQTAVAARLGIPLSYLRKSPPSLQAHNLNHWLGQEHNEKLLLRFDGAAVRAVFTPRYIPADNAEVVERLLGIGYGPETPVRLRLDERFLHLALPDDGRAFSVQPKDRVIPGLSVGNSEVGLSSLTVAGFFLRLVCTNGMVSRTEVGGSFRHLSRRILDDFPGALARAGRELEARGSQFRVSISSKVSEPESTMSSFNRRFLLTPEECDAASWGWQAEPGDTMFAVVNAYTKGAQYPGLPADSAYRLEKVGGDILSLVR